METEDYSIFLADSIIEILSNRHDEDGVNAAISQIAQAQSASADAAADLRRRLAARLNERAGLQRNLEGIMKLYLGAARTSDPQPMRVQATDHSAAAVDLKAKVVSTGDDAKIQIGTDVEAELQEFRKQLMKQGASEADAQKVETAAKDLAAEVSKSAAATEKVNTLKQAAENIGGALPVVMSIAVKIVGRLLGLPT